ncbi:unnamed protein product [Spodoptera exigua]|nr:unnamed protein product [Spodoptera exigua]
MNCKAGLLFFIILLIGSFALPAPEDDMSIFFDHTDANARIIGGTEVAAGTHPHMVALIVGVTVKNFICGGSLLTQRTVLTAAHCVDNVYGINWVIRSARVAVGSTRWDSGTDYSILRNVTHPDYNRCIVKNDISVLITASNVVLNSRCSLLPSLTNTLMRECPP